MLLQQMQVLYIFIIVQHIQILNNVILSIIMLNGMEGLFLFIKIQYIRMQNIVYLLITLRNTEVLWAKLF
jgi:hypothetical protein